MRRRMRETFQDGQIIGNPFVAVRGSSSFPPSFHRSPHRSLLPSILPSTLRPSRLFILLFLLPFLNSDLSCLYYLYILPCISSSSWLFIFPFIPYHTITVPTHLASFLSLCPSVPYLLPPFSSLHPLLDPTIPTIHPSCRIILPESLLSSSPLPSHRFTFQPFARATTS